MMGKNRRRRTAFGDRAMPRAEELLDEANACHDDDPPRGAALLREIDPAALDAGRRPLLAFLLNHVLGEKFGLWHEAFERQQQLIAADPQPGVELLRHAPVAALLGGSAQQAQAAVARLAAAADGRTDAAQAFVAIAAASFTAPQLDAAAAGAAARRALEGVERFHTDPAPALDSAFGRVTNNLASHLVERPIADLANPDLARALREAAAHAQRFWQRAGQWLQHERAHYLRALAGNALGDGALAATEARAGLALLDAHDTAQEETVDRAFLEQELVQALRLVDDAAAAAASARAQAIVATWSDESLQRWFADREARNDALRARST
jgi:hypothetical protein